MKNEKKKYDRRYASERHAEEMDRRHNPDEGGPILYRADLLNAAKKAKGYKIGFRDIAAATGLSVSTVCSAFDGNASKLESLWKLCRFFNIPWIALFDVDKKLTVEIDRKARPGNSLYLAAHEYIGLRIAAVDPTIVTPKPKKPTAARRAK